jgi:hypothetical protein
VSPGPVPQAIRRAHRGPGGGGCSVGSVDWQTVISTAVGVLGGGMITAIFAWRGSRELRREAEKLRQLTLKLIQILAASGQIEVSEWDPETGEPSSWPVGIEAQILYDVEALPLWKRMWRRVFGG